MFFADERFCSRNRSTCFFSWPEPLAGDDLKQRRLLRDGLVEFLLQRLLDPPRPGCRCHAGRASASFTQVKTSHMTPGMGVAVEVRVAVGARVSR